MLVIIPEVFAEALWSYGCRGVQVMSASIDRRLPWPGGRSVGPARNRRIWFRPLAVQFLDFCFDILDDRVNVISLRVRTLGACNGGLDSDRPVFREDAVLLCGTVPVPRIFLAGDAGRFAGRIDGFVPLKLIPRSTFG